MTQRGRGGYGRNRRGRTDVLGDGGIWTDVRSYVCVGWFGIDSAGCGYLGGNS